MRRAIFALIATTVFVGCKKQEPPPEPFHGPLTIEHVMGSKDLVKPLDPWDAAFAKLSSKLGPPTRVEANTHGKSFQWAASAGEACAYVEIGQADGAKFRKTGLVVGSVQSPMTVDKSGPVGNRAQCLEILGQAGPPEDPAAAPPPADGVATPELVVDNAVKGRSKWVGKQVRVTGSLEGIGGILLTIGKAGMSCTLAGDPPPDLVLGSEITVEGPVKMQTMVSGGGDVSMRAELSPCTIVSGGTAAAGAADGSGSGSAGSATP